jgi:hypothetical protein
LCGDAHASNFGLFGTPERRMLFDINDFDVTLPAPWEWDVKRLAVAASLEVMGRDRDFAPSDRRAIVMAGPSARSHVRPLAYAQRPLRGHMPVGATEFAIASYVGKADTFDRAIGDFSVAYADQNERDYEAFTTAVKSGRLTAQTGL